MLTITPASSDALSTSTTSIQEQLLNRDEGPVIIKIDPGASVTQILRQLPHIYAQQPQDLPIISKASSVEWIKSSGTALAGESEDVGSLKAKENFKSELMSALRAEHIEDGMFHPAEYIVQSAFEKNPEIVGQWIQSLFVDNYYKRPAIAGSILRLLGRLPYSLVGFTGTLLSVAGLIHQEVQVRDSSVRALEAWGGASSRVVLENHVDRESAPRLARYIKQVIKDLSD